MKAVTFALLASLVLSTSLASAQAPATCDGVCVSKEDMQTLLKLAQEEQCLKTTKPALSMSPITIVTDQDGRVYYSGSNPHPYTVNLAWCDYTLTGTGKLDVKVAMKVPPESGFRFRPKAFVGYLPVEALRPGNTAKSGIDAGLLVEPLYFHNVNLDVAVGVRSFGGGIGLDLLKNFGGYVGYAMTWSGFRSNVEAGLWFAFW